MNMRVMQQICDELEVQGKRKSDLNNALRQGMKDNAARRIAKREESERIKQDDVDAFEGRRAFQEASYKYYNLNAGKTDRDREQAEMNRRDRDEKMHTLRTDAYIDQRERGRERQRQHMVWELDRQSEAINQKGKLMRMRNEAER